MNMPVLGYVIRMFPQLSETFVANEILELDRLGVPIRIYSYRRPTTPVPHECVRLIRAPLTYLPDPLYRHPWPILRANLAVYRRNTARYRRTARYVLDYTRTERNLDTWRRFLQAGYLASLVEGSDVQHLHAHFAHGATRVAMLASMLTGLQFSFTAHARDIYTANPDLLREKIEAAAYVVTCTRANQDHLQALVETDQRDKIKLGYHGVDLTKFSPAEEPVSTDTPLILSVGRLVRKKGFPHLVRACSLLKERGHSFRCLIVGEGPERGTLEHMARTLGIEDMVSFPGSCSQEELLHIYRRATVFALPCQILENGDRDGIPNVLLEAMAVGVPVVSSPISGIRELIEDEHNGLLMREQNAEALASALERLVRDSGLRARLGRNGRSTVSRTFDSAATTRWLAQLFTEGSRARSQPAASPAIHNAAIAQPG